MDTKPEIKQEYRYAIAPKGKRFLAFLIDIGLFIGFVFLIRQPVIELVASRLGIILTSTTPAEKAALEKFYLAIDCAIGLPIALLVYLLPPFFFKNGQTLGKKTMGLILIRKNGGKPTVMNLMARTLVGFWILEYIGSLLLFFAFFFLTCAFVLTNRQGRALHDIVGRTIVVDKNAVLVDIIQKPIEDIEIDTVEVIEEEPAS